MIKLIVSDVDGTLVPDGSAQINPALFDTILKLREKGIQFAIASGRQWYSVENTFEPVKKKIFYIADNGSYIGCCGRELYIYAIDRELVHRFIRRARAYTDLTLLYAGPDADYMDAKDEALLRWLKEGYHFHVTQVEDLLALDVPCLKLSLYRPNGIEAATREICREFRDELKMTCSGEMWLDSMAPGIHKGKAVQTLQESLGILPEETMAFGDQFNDIEMLGRAYYSFAVANARDEVKRAARFQADSNVKDGVLKILKLLL